MKKPRSPRPEKVRYSLPTALLQGGILPESPANTDVVRDVKGANTRMSKVGTFVEGGGLIESQITGRFYMKSGIASSSLEFVASPLSDSRAHRRLKKAAKASEADLGKDLSSLSVEEFILSLCR